MIRLVHAEDAPRLRGFRCLPDPYLDIDEDDELVPIEEPEDIDGVENFCRNVYGWSNDPFIHEPIAIVMEDDDGRIIGVSASEDTLAPTAGRYVLVVAIATHRHGEGLGRVLLLAMLRLCAEKRPGEVATWLVRKTNEPSIRMCNSIEGHRRTGEPGDAEFYRYWFPLPENLPPIV